MIGIPLEERMSAMEAELARLKQHLPVNEQVSATPWWEQRFGAFADSEEYEEAARLGRAYRESLRTQDEDNKSS